MAKLLNLELDLLKEEAVLAVQQFRTNVWIQRGRAVRKFSEQSCCQHNSVLHLMSHIHILSDLAYYHSPGGEYKVLFLLKLNWNYVCHYH